MIPLSHNIHVNCQFYFVFSISHLCFIVLNYEFYGVKIIINLLLCDIYI